MSTRKRCAALPKALYGSGVMIVTNAQLPSLQISCTR